MGSEPVLSILDWTQSDQESVDQTPSIYHQSYDESSMGVSKSCFLCCWGVFPKIHAYFM